MKTATYLRRIKLSETPVPTLSLLTELIKNMNYIMTGAVRLKIIMQSDARNAEL